MERRRAVNAHNGDVDAKMEPWRVRRSVDADRHPIDEEKDPDPR
jgi:hypothetical protein